VNYGSGEIIQNRIYYAEKAGFLLVAFLLGLVTILIFALRHSYDYDEKNIMVFEIIIRTFGVISVSSFASWFFIRSHEAV
jgi:hypothetical protein